MHAKQVLWTKFGVNSSRHTDKTNRHVTETGSLEADQIYSYSTHRVSTEHSLHQLGLRAKQLNISSIQMQITSITSSWRFPVRSNTSRKFAHTVWHNDEPMGVKKMADIYKVVQQHVQGVAGRLLMTFVTNSLLATVKKFFKRSAFAPTSSDSQWLFFCHPVTVWLNKQPKVNMSWLSYTRKWSPQPVLPGNTYLEVTQGSYHRQRLTAMRSSHSIYCNK